MTPKTTQFPNMSSRAMRKLHGKCTDPPEIPVPVDDQSEDDAEESATASVTYKSKNCNPFDLVISQISILDSNTNIRAFRLFVNKC